MKKRCRVMSRRDGFTIVESVISIIIVAMVVGLMSIVIRSILRYQEHRNNVTAFHMYLRMIESPEYQFKYLNHQHHQLILSANQKRYVIGQSVNSIRLTTDKGGYVPLIDDVAAVNWHYDRNILSTRLVMQNGDQFTARSLMKKESRQ
ncbi:competence type IV pilus minor pilin ComGF [Nicoliella lavandulae]|uniref:Competence type IV pilus minor pilin ComGF n=1 Tax=Nicoliella lavandulae TaxID=3082954 RepID=A0ABU8SKP0_9LACO